MKTKKTIVLLRSVSGAGKSTLANLLAYNEGWVSVCADDYFTDVYGNYNFDASKLGIAHKECQQKFMEALSDPTVEGVVVANTNTKEREFSFYESAAKEAGAVFISLVVENRHGNTDVHNVPSFAKENQAKNIMNSIKLI
jgi:predicted kinase